VKGPAKEVEVERAIMAVGSVRASVDAVGNLKADLLERRVLQPLGNCIRTRLVSDELDGSGDRLRGRPHAARWRTGLPPYGKLWEEASEEERQRYMEERKKRMASRND
jgi:hypothetical protein